MATDLRVRCPKCERGDMWCVEHVYREAQVYWPTFAGAGEGRVYVGNDYEDSPGNGASAFVEYYCRECGASWDSYPELENALRGLQQLRGLVATLARMQKDGEPGDAMETLNSLISAARQITGLKPEEEGD